jgi:hypothetical protein
MIARDLQHEQRNASAPADTVAGKTNMDTTRRYAGMRRTLLAVLTVFSIGVASAGAVHAADFPLSGVFTFNGVDSALSGTFGPSTYNASSGGITAGAFNVPSATLQFASGADSQVTVHYQITQTNTSSGQVADDGVAVLTSATLMLHVIDAHTQAMLWSVGSTCDFGPFVLALAGTGAVSGLDLGANGFTIPAVSTSACGGHGDPLSSGIAGDQSRTQLLLAGDFTPPLDKLFADGFDPLN